MIRQFVLSFNSYLNDARGLDQPQAGCTQSWTSPINKRLNPCDQRCCCPRLDVKKIKVAVLLAIK